MSDTNSNPVLPETPSGLSSEKAIDLLTTAKYSDFTIRCENTTFKVHKFMLSANCDFFKAAIDGSFKEALENDITVKESTPWAVAAAIYYIYTADTGIPDNLHTIWPHLPDIQSMNESEKLERFVEFYMLADRFMLTSLNRDLAEEIASMVTIKNHKEDGPRIEFATNGAKHIYEILPVGDTCLRPCLTSNIALAAFICSKGREVFFGDAYLNHLRLLVQLAKLHDMSGLVTGMTVASTASSDSVVQSIAVLNGLLKLSSS